MQPPYFVENGEILMPSGFKLAPGVAILFYLLQHAATAQASTGLDAFNAGVRSYQAGRYQTALTEFLDARTAGIDSANLHYDLGSTYYRLGHYREAANEFSRLAQNPKLAGLMHYNLGLVALGQNKISLAASEFRLADSTTRSVKIRALAYEQLSRLSPTADLSPPRWVGFASIGGGYDSNVSLLARSNLIPAAGRGSSYGDLLTGVIGQLDGTPNKGLRLIATLYHVSYPSLHRYDQTLLRSGLAYRYPLARWRMEAAGYINDSYLDGKTFETFGSLGIRAWRPLSTHWTLKLKYLYSHVKGAAAYSHLTGTEQQFGAEAHWRNHPFGLHLGYNLELNDRSDLTVGNQFYSASPTRNEIYLKTAWWTTKKTKIYIRTDYQYSRYNKPDLNLQGNTLVSVRRKDHRYIEALGTQYRLASGCYLVGEYKHVHAKSSIPIYSYTSNRYSLKLVYFFSD